MKKVSDTAIGNKTWYVSNGSYFLRDMTDSQTMLDKGVYELIPPSMDAPMHLDEVSKEFEFPFKVYGMETEFVDKVITTYQNTNGNLGILLNGIKGTGKSVTAKMIANRLDMPVILITRSFPGINGYLAQIEQDVVIFIDEYEKVYGGSGSYNDDEEEESGKGDSALLSLMDGVYTTGFRKVFILTTNRLWINENMLNRPGRLRYKKQFSDLSLPQINEIIDDLLVDKKWREQIIEYLKPLSIVTVDILKAVISEVNIFSEEPLKCCKDLNVEFKDDEYQILDVTDKTEEPMVIASELTVATVHHFQSVANRSPKSATLHIGNCGYRCQEKPKGEVYTVVDDYGDLNKKFKIKFEKVKSIHSSFVF